ncbi:MAG TPA: PKD domain-containing protein [Chitinophagales bacterium]|nr:PKD domain-containing protein [Chitinophagales bacterium]
MKLLFLSAALSVALCKYSAGQIICIYCYDQNDSISSGVNNLLLNGGFEDTVCAGGYILDVFCPNSFYYSCDLTNWTCTGGGSGTYVCIFNNDPYSRSFIPEGSRAAYLGNSFPNACSPVSNDTSCLINLGCTVTGTPPGYPLNTSDYGGSTGVSIEQTVTGLVIGHTYVLEFWAGGEVNNGFFEANGLFAVDVGFGDTLMRCKPTPHSGGIGTTFIIEFNATSPSHTIKFTGWGHICSSCTEVVLDNIRLYTLAELSSTVPSCAGSFSASSFAASDTDVCEKFCVSFFDSSANNPTAWQWLFPGGTPSSSTDQNPTGICYNTAGTYDVTLITTSASGNDTLTLPNYITVYPTPPFPTITQAGYTLTSSAANSYQWQFNSVNIPGATNQSFIVLQTGLYTVIVSDSNGCVNSTNQYVLISGIADVSDAGISVYPNPSNGRFMVEWLNPEKIGTSGLMPAPIFSGADKISISVVDMLGQNIYSSEEFPSLGSTGLHSGKLEIDLFSDGKRCVTAGIYFIEIKPMNDGAGTGFIGMRKKIVIE